MLSFRRTDACVNNSFINKVLSLLQRDHHHWYGKYCQSDQQMIIICMRRSFTWTDAWSAGSLGTLASGVTFTPRRAHWNLTTSWSRAITEALVSMLSAFEKDDLLKVSQAILSSWDESTTLARTRSCQANQDRIGANKWGPIQFCWSENHAETFIEVAHIHVIWMGMGIWLYRIKSDDTFWWRFFQTQCHV